MLGRLSADHGEWPAGTAVAVKKLRPEYAEDAVALEALEREARAAGAVQHESFARRLYWQPGELVSEALPGRSLGNLLSARGRLGEDEVRRIGERLASGLAALHAAGWAHGDVKPDNVIVEGASRASWVDLGFAYELSGPPPTSRRGTAAYLSPEQARGQPGSAASDVFSLGVVLFELATGTHPVLRDEAGEASDPDLVLEGIEAANFGLPSARVSSLSPFLDHLIAAVLHRDPDQRPNAQDLAERLSGGENGPWWRECLRTEGGQLLVDRKDLIPLVGREEPMRVLFERYEQTRKLGGRVVWIEGNATSGKRRLVRDFVAQVRCSEHPPMYINERVPEWRQEWPGRPIRTAMRKALAIPPRGNLSSRDREELFAELPESLARSLIQILTPDATGPTEIAPEVALAAGLSYVARKRPVVLFINDVNWGDELTLGALSGLCEDIANTQLLLALGTRAEAAAHRPQALERLRERASRWGSATTLRLEPLDESAILEAVTATFAPSVPRLRLARVLAERSQGSPGLLTELLRQLVAHGNAVPAPNPSEGWVLTIVPDEIPAPRSAKRWVTERLAQLPVEDRLWLQRFSVIGGRLDPEFLGRAFDHSSTEEVRGWIETFVRSGWLTTDGTRTRFARPDERGTIYRSIAPERRARMHARAARAFAGTAAGSVDAAYQQAFHLRAAGAFDALLPIVRELVHKLSERGHPGRVRAVVGWGIEAIAALDAAERTVNEGDETRLMYIDRDALRVELLETAADLSDRLGYRRDQREILDLLADLELDPHKDPRTAGRVYLLHGRFQFHTGRFGLARGTLRNAVDFLQQAGELGLASDALCRLAQVQAQVGELDEAANLARRGRSLAQKPYERIQAELVLALVDLLGNRIARVLERVEAITSELESGAETALERGALAAAHVLSARAWNILGQTDRALRIIEEAVRLARQSGERRLETEARARQGKLLIDVDDPARAELVLRDALLLARETEDPLGEALANLFLGTLLLESDRGEAADSLEAATDRAHALGMHRAEALGLALLARLVMFSDPRKAIEIAERADELERSYGGEFLDRIVIVATRALVLRRAGHNRGAEEVERALRRSLRRQGQGLRKPELREAYRERAARLLETALSEDGPIYPRAPLATDES